MKLVKPLKIADGRAGLCHVFIRDLMLECSIGIHERERGEKQRVRINVDLAVREVSMAHGGDIADVVCYEKIASGVREIAAFGHVNLAETLAEKIAGMCLEDFRVRSARIRVEKIDVFADAAGAGVEIERFNPN